MAGPGGTDLRKFSNSLTPQNDPYYSRKPVPNSRVEGSGVPGLSKDEAVIAHERKLSMAGPGKTDLRKFSNRFTPAKDPFYSRKPVPDALIKDDAQSIDPVEKYENRERKLSMFQLTTDPFDQIAGRRTSVVNDSALGGGRRRSSAVAPDATHAAAAHHSGYDGDQLEPIQSRIDGPTATTTTTANTATAEDGTTRPMGLGEQQQGLVHDRVTGATNSSEGTTFAGSEQGHHV